MKHITTSEELLNAAPDRAIVEAAHAAIAEAEAEYASNAEAGTLPLQDIPEGDVSEFAAACRGYQKARGVRIYVTARFVAAVELGSSARRDVIDLDRRRREQEEKCHEARRRLETAIGTDGSPLSEPRTRELAFQLESCVSTLLGLEKACEAKEQALAAAMRLVSVLTLAGDMADARVADALKALLAAKDAE